MDTPKSEIVNAQLRASSAPSQIRRQNHGGEGAEGGGELPPESGELWLNETVERLGRDDYTQTRARLAS
jgi:hypothetical protein